MTNNSFMKLSLKNCLEFERPILVLENKIAEIKKKMEKAQNKEVDKILKRLNRQLEELKSYTFQNLTRWQKVQLARHPLRPYTMDYVNRIFTDFMELYGDRYYGDDHAIVSGMAFLDSEPIMIIGHQKGRNTPERKYRNFGMANPEGYRKAYRLMKLAEKFNRPIISFLDTPGAFPGQEAEERGQAEAIARNIQLMCRLKVPIISIVIGEGASGGALGIGVCDELYMLENTWYSVISPESCSSILWKSWEYKEQAAASLKLTAKDLLDMELTNGVIKEPLGGAHRDYSVIASSVSETLKMSLNQLKRKSISQLLDERFSRYVSIGRWNDTNI